MSIVVQPVEHAATQTPIPPVVARVEEDAQWPATVYAVCILQDAAGIAVDNPVDPDTDVEIQSLYSADVNAGLQSIASAPTSESELARSGSSRGSGGGSSGSSSRRGHGAGSSSTADADSSRNTRHHYFAFKELCFTYPGQYTLGIHVYTYDPLSGVTLVATMTSATIDVVDGADPQERPTKNERRILSRLRTNENTSMLGLP